MPNFISDEDMEKLETQTKTSQNKVISDEEMNALEKAHSGSQDKKEGTFRGVPIMAGMPIGAAVLSTAPEALGLLNKVKNVPVKPPVSQEFSNLVMNSDTLPADMAQYVKTQNLAKDAVPTAETIEPLIPQGVKRFAKNAGKTGLGLLGLKETYNVIRGLLK